MVGLSEHIRKPSRPISLVTGSSGFIGRKLVTALLAEGIPVRTLSRSEAWENVEHVKASLSEREKIEQAMDGVEVVYHLAGYGSPSATSQQLAEMYLVNAVGTLNLLAAADRAGVKRVVSASSAAVYGNVDSVSLSENSTVSPTTPYGLTKLAQEQACEMYARGGHVETVSLRLFNVYGSGESMDDDNLKLIPTIIRRIQRCQPVQVFGDGMQTRDFVHVDDVVSAFITSAVAPLQGHRVINVGTGVGTSIRDVILEVAKVIGGDVVWDLQPLRKGEVTRSVANIDRAVSVGIRPSIDFEHGVRDLADLDFR